MTPIQMLKAKAKELLTTEHEFVDSIEVVLTSDAKYGNQNGQRMGKYCPLSKRVVLWDVFNGTPHPEIVIDTIFPTYMHELIHAIQHRNMGTLVYLLTLVLCRPLFEAGAREIENDLYRDIERKASQPIISKEKLN